VESSQARQTREKREMENRHNQEKSDFETTVKNLQSNERFGARKEIMDRQRQEKRDMLERHNQERRTKKR
ncbi:MAG: hypothetical protein AAB091_04810, partial [Elusimicrobiota bacterium]